jgi:hypothetical protein
VLLLFFADAGCRVAASVPYVIPVPPAGIGFATIGSLVARTGYLQEA